MFQHVLTRWMFWTEAWVRAAGDSQAERGRCFGELQPALLDLRGGATPTLKTFHKQNVIQLLILMISCTCYAQHIEGTRPFRVLLSVNKYAAQLIRCEWCRHSTETAALRQQKQTCNSTLPCHCVIFLEALTPRFAKPDFVTCDNANNGQREPKLEKAINTDQQMDFSSSLPPSHMDVFCQTPLSWKVLATIACLRLDILLRQEPHQMTSHALELPGSSADHCS